MPAAPVAGLPLSLTLSATVLSRSDGTACGLQSVQTWMPAPSVRAWLPVTWFPSSADAVETSAMAPPSVSASLSAKTLPTMGAAMRVVARAPP